MLKCYMVSINFIHAIKTKGYDVIFNDLFPHKKVLTGPYYTTSVMTSGLAIQCSTIN